MIQSIFGLIHESEQIYKVNWPILELIWRLSSSKQITDSNQSISPLLTQEIPPCGNCRVFHNQWKCKIIFLKKWKKSAILKIISPMYSVSCYDAIRSGFKSPHGQKFQFIKQDFSNSIFQNPCADQYTEWDNELWSFNLTSTLPYKYKFR